MAQLAACYKAPVLNTEAAGVEKKAQPVRTWIDHVVSEVGGPERLVAVAAEDPLDAVQIVDEQVQGVPEVGRAVVAWPVTSETAALLMLMPGEARAL